VKDRHLLTTDLVAAFPEPKQLFEELHACLEDIASVADAGYGSPFILVNHLLAAVPGLATELLLRDQEHRAGLLEQYVGTALSVVVEAGDSSLVDGYVLRSEGTPKVLAQLAEAYARFEPPRPYTHQEVELFKRIFESKDPAVLIVASHMTRQVAKRSPALAVELICLADFEVSPRATHDMFMWLAGKETIPEAEVAGKRNDLLRKLVVLKELDDYWVRAFLAASIKKDPVSVVALVMARLVEAKHRDDWSYKPLDKEYRGEGLGLMDIEAGPQLLRDLLDWALEESIDISSARQIGEAISGLCGDYSEAVLNVLLDWMSSGTQAHAKSCRRASHLSFTSNPSSSATFSVRLKSLGATL
jgi:GNAT superfamily N-acetyltransferase